ncbi:signal peptidase I [Salinigranum salinum]|jgi:signal peptidase|uniref:signal peptidase I n=1 Tax=Salinigranum salinum TaxID=1364937 RepID=UPI001260478C|nr:signal peptidase I [Salinigranum salinum]
MIRRAVKAVAALALLIVVAVLLANAFPWFAGADYSYTVQSGSMEPAIPTGSVVFVEDVPANDIEEGDVITFAESGNGPTTTHRVIEKFETDDTVRFRTKGDANEDPDPEPVYRGAVVGVVVFSVPFVGYLSAFASTKLGWIVLVVLPVTLWIGSEMWELWKAGTRSAEETK